MNEGFAGVYEEYYEKIYNYVYYRVLNHHDAEDVVAETFFKALDHFAEFERKNGASVSTWIFAIARNAVNDYFRKTKKAVIVSIGELKHSDNGDECAPAEQDDMQRLRELLAELDERSREALSLRY